METKFRVVARNFETGAERVVMPNLIRQEADSFISSFVPMPGELAAVVPEPPPPKRPLPLTGSFGKLAIIKPTRFEDGEQWYLCECDCWKTHDRRKPRRKEIRGSRLSAGLTKSCGCLAGDAGAEVLSGFSERKRKKIAKAGGLSTKPGRIEAKKMEAAHDARRVVIPEKILRDAERRQRLGESSLRELAAELGYPHATLAKKIKEFRESH